MWNDLNTRVVKILLNLISNMFYIFIMFLKCCKMLYMLTRRVGTINKHHVLIYCRRSIQQVVCVRFVTVLQKDCYSILYSQIAWIHSASMALVTKKIISLLVMTMLITKLHWGTILARPFPILIQHGKNHRGFSKTTLTNLTSKDDELKSVLEEHTILALVFVETFCSQLHFFEFRIVKSIMSLFWHIYDQKRLVSKSTLVNDVVENIGTWFMASCKYV